jgi:hypothetical protein
VEEHHHRVRRPSGRIALREVHREGPLDGIAARISDECGAVNRLDVEATARHGEQVA